MINRTKVQEQFHYFNIKGDVDSIYGDWATSTDGDVVNYHYPYAILSFHFNDYDWIEHLKSKVWFKQECESDLKHALHRAKEILSYKCCL